MTKNLTLWQMDAPEALTNSTDNPGSADIDPVSEAFETVRTTMALIDSGRPAYWRCRNLGGDVIKIVTDPEPGFYAEYSPTELVMMSPLPPRTMQLIHCIKKRWGGIVVKVEEVKHG